MRNTDLLPGTYAARTTGGYELGFVGQIGELALLEGDHDVPGPLERRVDPKLLYVGISPSKVSMPSRSSGSIASGKRARRCACRGSAPNAGSHRCARCRSRRFGSQVGNLRPWRGHASVLRVAGEPSQDRVGVAMRGA